MSKIYGDNHWQGNNNYGNFAGKMGINFGRGRDLNTRWTGNWGNYSDFGRHLFNNENQKQLAATIELLALLVGQLEQDNNEQNESDYHSNLEPLGNGTK